MKHIIYKTTNLVNSKIYIGYHCAKTENDGYLGSGILLKNALEKYGKENFIREILFEFDNEEDARKKEAEIVNESFLDRKDVYNMNKGGKGSWYNINERLKEDNEFYDKFCQSVKDGIRKGYKNGSYDESILKFIERNILRNKISPPFQGKKHSETTKKKISENNGSKLESDILDKRKKDYEEIEKTKGWVGVLAKKWNVSHTQVRRMLIKFESSHLDRTF